MIKRKAGNYKEVDGLEIIIVKKYKTAQITKSITRPLKRAKTTANVR